jgi:hypothetical protein
MKVAVVIVLMSLAITTISCSSSRNFSNVKKEFDASMVKMQFKSVADMNDSYFDIKENNFFEFYRQLFDSVKNSSYPGTYTVVNDTFYLKFYNKKGKKLLGSKAVVDEAKHEIIFFK